MKKPKKPKERITVGITCAHPHVESKVFRQILNECLGLLESISAKAKPEKLPPVKWLVVKASMQSPLSLEVEPSALRGNALSGFAIKGIGKLNESPVVPKHYSEVSLRHAQRISEMMTNGIKAVSFSSPSYGTAEVTRDLADNVFEIDPDTLSQDNVVEDAIYKVGKHQAWTTLVGRLEDLLTHKRNHFRLFEAIAPNRPIKCFFDESKLDRIKDALPKRVAVYGLVSYSDEGAPDSIEVETLKVLEAKSGTRKIEDFPVDLCPGESSLSFVRRLRDAE